MFSACGWCGGPADGTERHDECAQALWNLAEHQGRAARGAAIMAEVLLEESAITGARASMVQTLRPTG